ncbi:MAG: OB-fold domain-containing protein [Oscillospiraceae bacterium]|nr:OB-fold domain-containing protein [Oscillospiraceae bacterium]
MFYYLRGTIAAIDEDIAVVDCGGVGFACYTTAATISKLKLGTE